MELILIYATVFLYLLSLAAYWLYFFRKTPLFEYSSLIVLGLGGLSHLCSLLYRSMILNYLPLTSSYETLSFLSFCIILIILLIQLRHKITVLGSFILPVALLIFIVALGMYKEIEPVKLIFRNRWFSVHLPFVFLSYANFVMSLGISIVYLIQEHQVKSHRIATAGPTSASPCATSRSGPS